MPVPDFSGFTPIDTSGGTDGVSASDATGDQGVLSGLGDLFSSVGVAVSQGIKASQSPVQVGPKNAGVLYNPATGTYTSAYGVAAQSTLSPFLLLLFVGAIFFVAFRK